MIKFSYMQDEMLENTKTKICFVITKGVWGGAQKYVYNLAINLPKDSFDIVVVAGKGEGLKSKLEEKGIKVIPIESLWRDIAIFSEIKSFFKLYKIIRKIKPDILHLNSPKAGGFGSFIGRILGVKKIIFTAHGWTFNEDRPVLQNALILFFSWLTIIFCHKVITIAPSEEEQAKTIPFVNPRKIILIRNGLEKVDFKERGLARKELLSIVQDSRFKIQDSGLWIGTLAELHKNKGLEFAVEAVKKIESPFIFFILGEGEERIKIENLIKKYNLQEKVILTGFLKNANEYLKAFDVFILPSMKEGLPYTILEAGMAGLPVIASSVGGIPDIINNGKNGILTTKGRAGEINRAIHFFMDNPKERELFAQNLKQKIEKDYSIDQMLEKTIRLYKTF